MASLLESQVKKLVAQNFKGRLLKGTLRRETRTINSAGDAVAGGSTTYTFDGIRENISVNYASRASIPVTDVAVLVILGSLPDGVEPRQGDKIQIPKGRGAWVQIRQVMQIDPAGASGRYACYQIEAP
jgi:hypothetical protein